MATGKPSLVSGLPAVPCRHRHAPSARPAPCPLEMHVRVLGQGLPALASAEQSPSRQAGVRFSTAGMMPKHMQPPPYTVMLTHCH